MVIKRKSFYQKLAFFLFQQKIIIAKWELNLFGVVSLVSGIIIGGYLAVSNFLTVFAAPLLVSEGVTTDGEWSQGVLDDVSVNSGAIQINGNGGAGWLTGWQYRQPVTITNSGAAQTNYQVRLVITYDAQMQSDFDDLRFTNASGTSLDYWLQTKTDSTSAIVWVEVDALAGTGTTVINMYYGNAGVSSGSSGVDTFTLFDDFEDGTINAAKWTEVDPSSKISESGGKLRFIYGSGSGNWNAGVYAVPTFARGDLSMDWEQRWISDYSPYDAFMFGWKDSTGGMSYTELVYGYYNQGDGFCTTNCQGYVYEDGSGRGNAGTWSNNTDYNLRVRMRSTGGAYYEKSINNGNSWTTDYTSSYSTETNLRPGWAHYSGDYLVDNVRVRKWMATEPTASFGTEESSLQSPGTYTSHNLDLQYIYKWGDCSGECIGASTAFAANVTIPANTSALFEVRHSANGSTGWSAWTTIDTYTSSGTKTKNRTEMVSLVGDITNRYVQTRITLTSSDGVSNPSVADYQYDFTTDVDPPSNISGGLGYSANGGDSLTTDTWYNYSAPYFTLSGATDVDSGMTGGYSGYWVCFGASNCEPTGGTFRTTANYTASSLVSGNTYYLRVKAVDAAGNIADTAYQAFIYKYDATNPSNPSGILPNPAGFTNVNNFSFSWNAGTDTYSLIKEYCYKTGADDAEDVCQAGTAVSDIEAYKEGTNIFYVRSRDNAGNTPSFYTQVNYYYSANAPSEPQNLQVELPGDNTNSFTFTWLEPASYTNPIAGYYYSINAIPNENNTTYTTARSIGPGPYATQQGTNVFYVIAVDSAGNKQWTSYASVEFAATTTAPGIPEGVIVTDSSNRVQGTFRLTVTWEEPENVGGGIDHYNVERSNDDGATWSEISRVAGTGYLDTGLTQNAWYCYRIYSSDNANAVSAPSSEICEQARGRFYSAPNLVGSPGVTPRIQSAVVEWLTDREGTSFVEYGETNAYDSESGNDNLVSAHSVTLTNLLPDTTYHYRVKWTDSDNNSAYSSDSTFTTADALSSPTSLSVTPAYNTENSFRFMWSEPLDEGVNVQGYFYSINSTPTEENTSFTASTSIGPGPYATQQGTNTFYVVAIDDANNINYANYASIDFKAETKAPSIPTGLIITDASNRETEDYSIALKWKKTKVSSQADEPVTYLVSRSTDNNIYEQIAELQSTGYLDVDLSNTTKYYYYVMAKDTAGATSAASTTVSDIPEGRYTTPPEIVSGPVVDPDSFSASVSWEMERETTSFVQYGFTEDLGEEQGESELTRSHSVNVEGLKPKTAYYYRVKSVDIDGNIYTSPAKIFTTLEAPRVSDVLASDVKLFDALITWETNKPTTTRIDYGLTTDYGFTVSDTSGSLTTTHTMKLENLQDGNIYHFRPTGFDSTGNSPESSDYVFTTLTFPKVLGISYENRSQGQTEVTWTTNVPTSSEVEYYNQVIAPKTQGNSAQVTEHSVLLFGLEDATNYQYRVKGFDQFGYQAISEENTFTTLEDTTPPIITGVQSESNTIGSGETSTVQIIVSWKTNEPTTSQVDYGVGLSSTDFSDQSEENAELVMDHLVVVSELSPAKTYHFRATSRDKAGNLSKSGSYTILTSRKRESFLQLVISNLEETFSWVGAAFK